MIKNNAITALKGIIVGGTMLVPGVSGGSMAMILGIYNRLVSAVSSFPKNKKENLMLLTFFAMGGGLGMILFAKPILSLIERFPMPMMYFFMGAVAGSIPLILKEAKVKELSWSTAVHFLIGIALVMLFSMIPEGEAKLQLTNGVLSYVLLGMAGFAAAVALVLPGISVSYLLLLMGLYHETMNAVSTLYFPFLVPMGIGLIAGVLLTTRILETAMVKKPQATYVIILGFVVGSVIEIFPGVPGLSTIAPSIIMAVLGYLAVQGVGKLERV